MGAAALPILAITSLFGVGTSIWSGIESRNARRKQESRNREQEEKYQKQIAEQRRIAEEQERIERERLLKNVGFKKEELALKETVFKERQKLEAREVEQKILNLKENYEDIYAEYNAAQTVRGFTNTLTNKKERLTHNYLEDNEGLALFKALVKTENEQSLKAFAIEREELETVEKLGKETGELNLQGIANKAEAAIQMSEFRIKSMREEVADLNRASIINDISTLFKTGVNFASPYIESSLYKSMSPKFNYSGNNYIEMMSNLTFSDKFKLGMYRTGMGSWG
jgi:hypothetical protein